MVSNNKTKTKISKLATTYHRVTYLDKRKINLYHKSHGNPLVKLLIHGLVTYDFHLQKLKFCICFPFCFSSFKFMIGQPKIVIFTVLNLMMVKM